MKYLPHLENKIEDTQGFKFYDHVLILREDDPLLPAILKVYEDQGIKDGAPTNKMKGIAFKTDLATAYPDCRLVVTKETMTVEGMIKIVYDLLKDKLNIAKYNSCKETLGDLKVAECFFTITILHLLY